ncbi:MAG TPA: hypothetical protein VJT75_07265 [Thermoleophilaceae bacterium]|nr:hypothetical protein [Thermoleophilaceae bacterium]
MAYGNDVTVYVEDIAGDQGGGMPGPWWMSPDVDIPAHSGTAFQGPNDVQIRVHAHEEPFLDEKIVAEVYVCRPSLAMSPTVDSVRIDPGNLLFRPPGVAGTEPIASFAGGTLTFAWTPGSAATAPDGPGHRCLILRAFPQSVTPPNSPFTVPAEQHEAQRNIEILATTKMQADMSRGGAGTPEDPRRRESGTGLWWEALETVGAGPRGRRFVVWAFDPNPEEHIPRGILRDLKKAKIRTISKEPPAQATIEIVGARGHEIDPGKLVGQRRFARRSGVGDGIFAERLLLGAATLELGPRKPAEVVLRFDHSNLDERTALVLHAAQFDERGEAEGGMTIVAIAPTDP